MSDVLTNSNVHQVAAEAGIRLDRALADALPDLATVAGPAGYLALCQRLLRPDEEVRVRQAVLQRAEAVVNAAPASAHDAGHFSLLLSIERALLAAASGDEMSEWLLCLQHHCSRGESG